MSDAKKIPFFCLTVIIMLVLLMFYGCEHKSENIPTFAPTVAFYMNEGWQAFARGEYQVAVENFTAAKNRDALDSTAYLGLGWAYARVHEFTKSISNFMLLLSFVKGDSIRADAYAGLSMTYSAQQRDSLAIDAARTALSLSPNYRFRYDAKITAAMLHVLIAQSYYNRRDYLKALQEVDTHLVSGYIQSLLKEGIIVSVTGKVVDVYVFSYTPLTGKAQLTLTRTVGDTAEVRAELVSVHSIKSVASRVEYQILTFEQGGSIVSFLGNPIPKAGDKFLVDYQYAPDYGEFLARLSKKIQELHGS